MHSISVSEIERASAYSISKVFGISSGKMQYRLTTGVSKAEIICALTGDCYIDNFGYVIIPSKYNVTNLNFGITAFGKTFSSKEEIIRHYKVSRDALNSELKKGYNIDEAVTYAAITKLKKLRKQCNMDINYFIDVNNIDSIIKEITELTDRIEHNKNVQKHDRLNIITDKDTDLKKYKFEVFGNKFISMKELCVYYDISEYAVYQALRTRGCTLEDAINQLLGKYILNGKRYRSLNALAADYGIGTTTLKTRLNNGMTLEEAVKGPLKSKNTEINVNGNIYTSANDAYKDLGISGSSVRKIIRETGKTHAEAIEELLNKKNDTNSRVGMTCERIFINGEPLSSVCKRYNLRYGTIIERKHRTNLDIKLILIDYIPYSYINMFGDLVLP